MSRTKALAIDPGASTGAAILRHDGTIWTATVPASDGDVSEVVKLILRSQPEVIIIERFLTTGMLSRYGIETLELIGAVKCLHYLTSDTAVVVLHAASVVPPFDLIRRTPGQRATQIPRAKKYLQALRANEGLPFTDHAVDALAHLFGWMTMQAIPLPEVCLA